MPIPILKKIPDADSCRYRLIGTSLLSRHYCFLQFNWRKVLFFWTLH